MNVQSINVAKKTQNPNFGALRIDKVELQNITSNLEELYPYTHSLSDNIRFWTSHGQCIPDERAYKLKLELGGDDVLFSEKEEKQIQDGALFENNELDIIEGLVKNAKRITKEKIMDSITRVKQLTKQIEDAQKGIEEERNLRERTWS